ncbi:hypothetical protein CVT26_006219 [Gymnopilus dilepis]|uniref:6-phosphogluconate dehydrogenase NADP-binding domain-containing protein n=1 Tax=Gymnopilus dilepis TaxID=231916 RepID=A0A409Y1E6_9AGAR|nr:hypothetical protein CVT26_006219 [Gymnopilus dilepis]
MSTIAVIAAGAMGSNVGRKFVEAGYTVLTSLEGRSDATRKRAEEAGMIDADLPSIIKKADILLSIIPPKDAIAFAERFLREYESAEMIKSEPIVFVDCNAVNVDTLRRMGTLFAATKIPFLDACIIGGPPSGSYVPTFYACADPKHGDALQEFQATVGRAGIKIRILGGQESGIGNASALKMSYAELSDSQPELLARITRAVPAMIPKAYRWVGEMEEIAGFVGREESDIYHGMANIYARIERSLTEGNEDIETLKEFVAKAKSRGV